MEADRGSVRRRSRKGRNERRNLRRWRRKRRKITAWTMVMPTRCIKVREVGRKNDMMSSGGGIDMSVLTVVRDKIVCTNEGHTKKKIRTRGNNNEVRIEVKSNIIARRSFGRVRQRKRNDNR